MTDRQLSVLVVEDDPRLLEILTSHLERMGFAVRGSLGGAEALLRLEEAPADVLISDVRMPGMDGRSLLQISRDRFPSTKVVLMTAFGSVDDAVEAMHAGAYTYVCKPFRVEEIASVLRNIAHELALGREVEGLREAVRERWSADRLIGNSAVMRQVRQTIRHAAQVQAPVLITGPSGSGKELAARAIHFEGARAASRFVPVNCAAIPEQLFESTLFGHRRGAFTGAVESQTGLLEQADGGTLFLDEVGEIPLQQQAKLLRVLQDGELTPVGAARSVRVDVRVIAATNRDLQAQVQARTFREDLFFRLDVLRVELPPLSARREDVPALAEQLLLAARRENGLAVQGICPEALEALSRYHWPGNVRELRNVLQRALLPAVGRKIDVGDLPASLRGARALEQPGEPAGPLTLADVEREHVQRVLLHCRWNRSEAAGMLGIDRRTLFNKIRRYGLVGPLTLRGAAGADTDGDPDAEEG